MMTDVLVFVIVWCGGIGVALLYPEGSPERTVGFALGYAVTGWLVGRENPRRVGKSRDLLP